MQAPAMAANLRATAILDYEREPLAGLAAALRREHGGGRAFVRATHRHLAAAVRPVYTLDELQPASVTLAKGQGSCSQRMGCLEALSRAAGVPTRVRALWVDGRFWYPRFRLSRPFIPGRILLIWPQFLLDDAWLDFDELYAPTAALVAQARAGFTNSGETLFDAVAHTPVDFLGKSRDCGVACAATSPVDLSRFVVGDEGFFDARDEVFARFGSLQHAWRGRAFEAIFGGRKSA